MKVIEVKIFPNSKQNKVEKEGDIYRVHVRAPAVEGKANKALLDMLAEYLQVKKNHLEIVRGEKARNKWIRILD